MGPVGPNDKENQVMMYKKYWYRYITSLKRIGIHLKLPDPDPYQNEKQDPDPFKKGLDPQHWPLLTFKKLTALTVNNLYSPTIRCPLNVNGLFHK